MNKGTYAGTCIQQPNKGDWIWPHTFLVHLSEQFECLLALAAFHMSQYDGVPNDNIWRWHLVEHLPSILNAPTLCIHVNDAISHKDIRLATTLNQLTMNKPAIFNLLLTIFVSRSSGK
jgi:hypothetical protein